VSSGGSFINDYSIPWDVGQNGRCIRIVNYSYDGQTSEGYASIDAPSGQYFYEDGISKSSLKLSREVVELLGYGDTTHFLGWIVIARKNVMTNHQYGRQLNALAQGIVHGGTSNSTTSISYRTFDGKSLSIERTDVGVYKITFPNNWMATKDDYIVLATGLGAISGGTNPLKASVAVKEQSYVTIDTSDDDSRNDGEFMFMIINMTDWT
jgi:hypothetical protein